MEDLRIREFTHKDVENFIRLAQSSFADEWIADGMSLEAFARQTKKIFRWNMIPYRLLTALMGIRWEAFVAEVNGHIVGGGMYNIRKERYWLNMLMVEPDYRRQGIGQALLVKRLERLSQRGAPFVTVSVLETNQASLGNLHKQGFVEYNRYSTYERSLPIPAGKDDHIVKARQMKASDKALFKEIERKTIPPFVLYTERAARIYFPSFWQKMYRRYAGGHDWAQAFDVDGETVGFLAAYHTEPMTKGFIYQPVITSENISYLPTMIHQAVTWIESTGVQSVKMGVSDHLGELGNYLLDTGWKKQRTWLYLVKWLDKKAKQEFMFDG